MSIEESSVLSGEEQLRRLSASSPAFFPATIPRPNSQQQLQPGSYPDPRSPPFAVMLADIPPSPALSALSGSSQYKQVASDPVLTEGRPRIVFDLSPSLLYNGNEKIVKIFAVEGEGMTLAYGQWIAAQLSGRTGVAAECFDTASRGGRYKRQDKAIALKLRGSYQDVKLASDLMLNEFTLGDDLRTFIIPTECGELLDLIDPNRTADLSVDGVQLQLRTHHGLRGSEQLLMSCRKEVYRLYGWESVGVEVKAGQLCALYSDLMALQLEHGVAIDIPSPVYSNSVPVLVSGADVQPALLALSQLPSSCESAKISIASDLLEYLRDKAYSDLVSICEESDCSIRFAVDSLEVYCGSGSGLQVALKKIHTKLYEYQSVQLHLECPSTVDLSSDLARLALNFPVSIEMVGSKFTLSGKKEEVERGMECLSHMLMGRPWLRSVHWAMTVPYDVREFVSGKKDGKLVKIIRETGVQLSLAPMSSGQNAKPEHLLIGLEGGNILSVLTALGLLLGELPAEITFHVPECQHKRLIGHGGRVIQQVMKKHAVYVKFLNACEAWETAYGTPYQEGLATCGLPNVIVRTPAKNGGVLEMVKDEIMEMAQEEGETVIVAEARAGRSMLLSKRAFILMSKEGREALLSFIKENSLGTKLYSSPSNDDDCVKWKTGVSRTGLEDELKALLDVADINALFFVKTPSSPALTTRSQTLSVSSSIDLFRPFASALYTRSSSPDTGLMDSFAQSLPSPPGAPGSGRSPLLSSPSLSSWSASPTTGSPRLSTLPQPISVEEEIAQVARIMDKCWVGLDLDGEILAVGPRGLNSAMDPIISPNTKSSSVYNTWAGRSFL